MSRDDEIDYRAMYPIEGRNRKRRSANPRPQRKSEPRGGFFSDEPKSLSPKDRVQKARTPKPAKRTGTRDIDGDGHPMPSMGKVAKEMLAKDLEITADEMIERLDAMGYDAAPTTISAYRKEIFDVLRLCEKHGSIIVPAWRD